MKTYLIWCPDNTYNTSGTAARTTVAQYENFSLNSKSLPSEVSASPTESAAFKTGAPPTGGQMHQPSIYTRWCVTSLLKFHEK